MNPQYLAEVQRKRKTDRDYFAEQAGEQAFLAHKNTRILAEYKEFLPAIRLESPCKGCPDSDGCPGGFLECGCE